MNAPPNDLLLGRYIDRPLLGAVEDPLLLAGWVIPKALEVSRVWVTVDGRPVADLHLNHLRPDLAKAFPMVAGAERFGFRASLDSSLLQGAEAVDVTVELSDGSSVPIGRIRTRSAARTGGPEEESASPPQHVPTDDTQTLRRPRFWRRGRTRWGQSSFLGGR